MTREEYLELLRRAILRSFMGPSGQEAILFEQEIDKAGYVLVLEKKP